MKKIGVQHCKIIRSQVKSVVNARHTLLEHSCGDYILFVDADDFLDSDYLIKIDNSLKQNDYPDILICGFKIVNENGTIVGINQSFGETEDILDDFYYGAEYTSLWRKAFKRQLYNKTNYKDFTTIFGDDWIFSKGLFDASKRISIDSDIACYNYRLNNNSITHSFSIERAKESILHRDIYLKQPNSKKQIQALIKSKFRQYLYVSKIMIEKKQLTFASFVLFSKEIYFSFNVNLKIGFRFNGKGEHLLFSLFRNKNFFWVWLLLNTIAKKNKNNNQIKTNTKRLIVGINLSMGGSTGTIMNNVFDWIIKKTTAFDFYTITPEQGNFNDHFGYDTNHSLFFKMKYFLKYQVFKTNVVDGEYYKENTRRVIHRINLLSKKYKTVLVHIHNIHHARLDVVSLYKYLSKKRMPVVYTVHDSWIYTGGCYCYDFIKCNKWQGDCNGCPQLIYKSQERLKKRVKALNSIGVFYYIPVSYWEKNEILLSKLNIKNIEVINGETNVLPVPFDEEFKTSLGLNGYKVLISVSSYWNDWKGIKYLYKLADILPESYKIMLVGGEIKPHKNIIHIPTKSSPEEVAKYYSIADVYLSTTQSEALGLTTCEAQICGLPIVGFGNGGSKETFTNKTGILVKNNSVEEMLKAAIDICEKRVVFNKKDIVEQGMKFSKYSSAPKYLEIYKKVFEGFDNDKI